MYTQLSLASGAAQRRAQLLADAAHARQLRELRASRRTRRSALKLTTRHLRPVRIAVARLVPQA